LKLSEDEKDVLNSSDVGIVVVVVVVVIVVADDAVDNVVAFPITGP
jgi:hypothetical protein